MPRAFRTALATTLALVLPALGEGPDAAERARRLIAASPSERQSQLAGPPAELGDGLYRALALESLRLQRAGQLASAIDVAGLAAEVAARTDDTAGRSEALWLRGAAEDLAGLREAAESSLTESLRLAETTGDAELRLKPLGALAVCDYRAGRWRQAEERLRAALELARGAGLTAATSRLSSTLGEVFRVQGRHDEARLACDEGLRLARQAGSAAHASIATGCLAIVATARGDYAAALRGFDAALRAAEELGLYENRVAALNNLGMVQQLQGDRGQALAYYDDVRAAAATAGDKAGLARALLNSGGLLRDLGRLEEARAALERGDALAEALGDAELRAHSAQALGDLEFARGAPEAARARYEAALDLRARQGVPWLEAALLQRVADTHLLQREWAPALERAGEARRKALERGDREALWRAHTSAGRALLAQGQAEAARRELEQAVAVIEELRATLAGPGELRQLFLENKLDPYRLLSGLCLAQGRAEEALAWSERARARLLSDMLVAGRVDPDAALGAEERDEQEKLRRELAEAGRLARAEAPAAEAPARRARLEEARRRQAAFLAALYARHPELQLRRADQPTLTLADLGPLLSPAPGRALLEYLWDDERVRLFVVTRGVGGAPRLSAFTLPTPPAELRRLVRTFRSALEGRDLEAAGQAERLHEAVLGPAREILSGTTDWTVAPDGPLWELPFQALAPGRGRFLAEDRALTLAPSLAVLLAARRSRPAPASEGLLALGDPRLPGAAGRPAALARMDASLPPLPEARLQVAELGRLYGPGSALLVGPEASEAALRREAGRHRVLHFATHGLLNDASPMHSQLVLAPAPEDGPDDGLLEAREVLELDLQADLAVLSACETGRGRVAGGEGLLGFPWAFLARGCPATVVSQWSVDSAATRGLMVAFHRRLRAGEPAARALQGAGRELRRRAAWRHPFFWAAFVVVGDGL